MQRRKGGGEVPAVEQNSSYFIIIFFREGKHEGFCEGVEGLPLALYYEHCIISRDVRVGRVYGDDL